MIACARGVRHSWSKTRKTTAGPLRVLVCDRCKVARVLSQDFRDTDALALAMASAPFIHTRTAGSD